MTHPRTSLRTEDPHTVEISVESYLSGVRIDSFLVRHFRNYTAYRMQRMIRAGAVSIDEEVVDLKARVYRRQRISIRLLEPPDKLIEPKPLPLDILHEDPWIIVLNKPAGQVAHPVGIYQTGTLSNALQNHFDNQTSLRGLLRPGIVHRLDRMTSGVIVVAKEHFAHRRLSLDFQRGRITKHYFAIVEGCVEPNAGTIDLPIGRAPGGGSILMSIGPAARDLRRACTQFEVIRRFNNHSLVRVTPATGRIHQIRVHLASLGHPVLGDEYYGPCGQVRQMPHSLRIKIDQSHSGCKSNTENRDRNGSLRSTNRHALHAAQISLSHPISLEKKTFQTPLPHDMQEMLARLAVPQQNQPDREHKYSKPTEIWS